MCFRKSFSNTHMRAPAWLEIMKQFRTPISIYFFHISYAIYQTHNWYPWIVFNTLMILVLPEPRALKCKCHIFMYIFQIYYGNFKSDKCIVIYAKCTIWTISTSPWHEIYSTYQFMGYELTEHDTTSYIKYIVHRSFKFSWLISTDSIDFVDKIICVEFSRQLCNDLGRKKCIHIRYIHPCCIQIQNNQQQFPWYNVSPAQLCAVISGGWVGVHNLDLIEASL